MPEPGAPDDDAVFGEGAAPAVRPALKAAPLTVVKARPRAAPPTQKTDPFVPKPSNAELDLDGAGDDAFTAKPTMTVVRFSQVQAPAPPVLQVLPPPRPARAEPLDPPMPLPQQRRPAEPLDPPMPPPRRPAEPLDPPMPPQRRPVEPLDPPMPPQRASTATPTAADPVVEGKTAAPARPSGPPKAAIVGGVAALCAAVLIVVGVSGKGATVGYSTDEHSALSALWRRSNVNPNAAVDAAVVDSVRRVLNTIARVMPSTTGGQPSTTTSLVVLSDRNPRAFVLPDGTVVVSVGMLRRLRSEAELAALFAHTLAHHRAGDVAAVIPLLKPTLALAISANPPTEALTAASIDEIAPRDEITEARADAAAIRALKLANWDAKAMRAVHDNVNGSGWSARHASWPTRPDALSAEEHRRLPGSNLLQNDTGKTNSADYEDRVLNLLRPK